MSSCETSDPVASLLEQGRTMSSTEQELAIGYVHITSSEPSQEKRQTPSEYAHYRQALQHAELLLMYAAEVGVEIDDELRDHVLRARATHSGGWDEQTTTHLLAALTKLAARLKPVSAESLTARATSTVQTVRKYWSVALCLAIAIVPFSMASFVTTGISNTIKADIVTANELAVKLRAQLGPYSPIDSAGSPNAMKRDNAAIIGELQQYAVSIRAIDARARQLNWMTMHTETDPFHSIRDDPKQINKKFQLPPALSNLSMAAEDRTVVYQDVRYFAQSVVDDVSFFYGAITVCILPVLYALLGTCAFLLRAFEQQMAARTFTPSAANSARFLIAGIGGGVVGLFNNFTFGQGASVPPLALAFLVGYAVDVFFAFLEGLLQSFTKTPATLSTGKA